MRSTDSNFARGDPAGRRPPAVLCDFDGTTACENVAQLLLTHFSDDGTRLQLQERSRQETITFREYQEQAFAATRASREAMSSLVRFKATLRPYFKELWQYCLAMDIPLAIVTIGLDFYVDALMNKEGLNGVPTYAVKTSFTPQGVILEYSHPWDGSGAATREVCHQWGNCKCSVLGQYRSKGYSIIYVGDGRSDFCPASMADQIFARGPLAQMCREHELPYTEFQDFQVVIQSLQSTLGRSRAGE